MTDDKKAKPKRRRKTPAAGTPEASPPIAAERAAAEAAAVAPTLSPAPPELAAEAAASPAAAPGPPTPPESPIAERAASGDGRAAPVGARAASDAGRAASQSEGGRAASEGEAEEDLASVVIDWKAAGAERPSSQPTLIAGSFAADSAATERPSRESTSSEQSTAADSPSESRGRARRASDVDLELPVVDLTPEPVVPEPLPRRSGSLAAQTDAAVDASPRRSGSVAAQSEASAGGTSPRRSGSLAAQADPAGEASPRRSGSLAAQGDASGESSPRRSGSLAVQSEASAGEASPRRPGSLAAQGDAPGESSPRRSGSLAAQSEASTGESSPRRSGSLAAQGDASGESSPRRSGSLAAQAEGTAGEPARPEHERRVGERRAGERRAGFEAAAVAIDDDGWPLESAEPPSLAGEAGAQAAQAAATAPPTAAQLPSPAAAAYEAARIVGEMVGDIDSAPGAALVAAAAAGAAIEAARARVAAGEPERPVAPPPSSDASTRDPVITVRMQRDRILRALAEDIAATTVSGSAGVATATGERAGSQPGAVSARGESGRAATHPGRAASQPGELTGDEFDDGVDPVAIAAAAIARLRERARSDLAELRVHYHRHDIVVLVIALVIIAIAGRFHSGLVSPPTVPFEPGAEHGLTFEQPRGWLMSPGEPPPAPRILRDPTPVAARPPGGAYRIELTSPSDATARIEVVIDKKPAWSNIVTGLDLDRRTRWGELYTLDDSAVRSVEDHQWLRTAYRFAHAVDKGDVPRIDRALEYATIDREQIYVLTFFGSPAEIDQLEDIVAPTLRVATQTGLPLVPQTGHLSARRYPNAVSRAFDATVMVVVADLVDGRLRARGGGSGVIVGKDGSILTNYHVIHDRNGRLHDAFVIGRFSEQDKAPQLHCAGKPSRSKLQRELDLALIKCDLDLDGRSWSPSKGATWPTLTLAHSADIKMGQRIWVLGYPDVGGGGLTLSQGAVEGWSGVDGAAGKDFIKTDAAIRHGNSGGPVVGDDGRLIGIASAVRTKQNSAGDIVEIVQAGGRLRPIAAAGDLLAIAAAGWTPREGATDVELQPSAIEVPAEGVQIQTHVLDAANQAAVRDALVMVLRPGINAKTVDVNRLDDQVLAYGRSNAQGEVALKQPVPVPGTYTVIAIARGYEPLIGEGELILAADTPAVFDPWGKLQLRSR